MHKYGYISRLKPHHHGPLAFTLGFDEVAAERDVSVKVIAEDCVFPLALIEPHPHLIVSLQLQHQALALHDGAVTGLGVQDGHLLFVLHYVQVCLLLVPRVHVQAEEVNPWHVAEELSCEHVEVAVQVDQLSVEHQGLVVVVAVQGFFAAYGKSSVVGLTGFPRNSYAALGAFYAGVSSLTCIPCLACFSIGPTLPSVSLFPFEDSDVYLWNHLVLGVSAAMLLRLIHWVTTSPTLCSPAVAVVSVVVCGFLPVISRVISVLVSLRVWGSVWLSPLRTHQHQQSYTHHRQGSPTTMAHL